jgi:hypothetical protein
LKFVNQGVRQWIRWWRTHGGMNILVFARYHHIGLFDQDLHHELQQLQHSSALYYNLGMLCGMFMWIQNLFMEACLLPMDRIIIINMPFIHIKGFLYLRWRIKRKTQQQSSHRKRRWDAQTSVVHSNILSSSTRDEDSLQNFTENFYFNKTIACCMRRFF